MTLETGRQFGHYKIHSHIGTGGMGEVYLAEDTKLERHVALKILPVDVAQNAERMRRFVREAKAASSFNHPNIAHIYEIGEADGTSFIAMEFVEGDTLREKIHGERIDLRTLLKYLAQVADGLAKAHGAGIVHRDLKPDNIMISRDGFAKILDFGLAKLVEPQKSPDTNQEQLNEAATVIMPQPLSTPGMIMGTVGYMSPEQAQGRRELDQRSDIFSFGCVLYEGVTRQQPFGGDSLVDTLHKIIHAPAPPISDFNPDAPPELQRILRRCLQKDAEERYQTIKDVAIELKELRREMENAAEVEHLISPETASIAHTSEAGDKTIIFGKTTSASTAEIAVRSTSSAEYVVNQIKRHRTGAFVAVAILAVGGLIFGLYKFYGSRQLPANAPIRVTPLTSSSGVERSPALSPDGRQVAFVWEGEKNDNFDIYVKIIDAGTPLRLTTSQGRDMSPAWSPDNRFVAFLRGTGEDKGFYLVPALGGAERKLADAFGWNGAGVLSQYIDWLPDGKTLVVVDKTAESEPWSIFLLSVETGEKRQLTQPPATDDGDDLVALSPDGKTLAFTRFRDEIVNDIHLMPIAGGEPARLTFDDALVLGLDWTRDGERIVFSSDRAGVSALWTIPASGSTPAPVAGVGENVGELSVSRQSDHLVYAQLSFEMNLWRIELANRVAGSGRRNASPPTKFIASTRREHDPQFSPSGQRIAFGASRSGKDEIWVCDSEGQNSTQLTNLGSASSPRWSPDNRFIAFDSRAGGNADIHIISADGGSPRRLTIETSEEVLPSWSRDGRFVYFASKRTGRHEVWKMPAAGGEAVQVTREGGFTAFESTDGRVLYYLKGRSDSSVWSVSIEGGAETKVFDHQVGRSWAVAERGIYFFNFPPGGAKPYTLEFFDFNTSQTTQLAMLEAPARSFAIYVITVSPDERWLVYEQRDQLDYDLMLVENFR